MFQIEYPDFSVARCSYHCPVMTVWHELDREDILCVTRSNRTSQLELLTLIGRLVCVDVEVLVIGTRGKKTA